ncbi:kinase-like domain-containing protein [Gigaspora rosea]|uniref:Kinase-like domain-containing protein n=1 Tax=Gigaspora rosea TaxID=44941 RepID=A0A397V1P6_9GLOM|nr:kinase-like domain-containing protein [Gigaspora rosea]
MLQFRVKDYEDAIEWIPFDRLSNVKEIGKGGFGSVYSASWLDGIRKVEKINDGDIYKRTREPSSIVALKTLTGYIHADFHSGNILYDEGAYIADLGLSRKKDEKVLEGDIFGVMPYVAPEVLSGEHDFTQAADVYGFGIIMAEMTTG